MIEFVCFFDCNKKQVSSLGLMLANPQSMPSIKTLIKQARYKDALDALEKLVPKHLENDIILLYSRATNLENQINGGVISSENAGIEMARIRAAILAIYDAADIQELPDEEPKTPSTPSNLGRDTAGFGADSEPIDIPEIEPFEESLIVPKGADGLTKILFLTANPADKENLAVNKEATKVQVDSQGRALDVVTCPHIDRGSMIKMVAFEKPQIVHFSGHGSKGGIVMANLDDNRAEEVDTEDLKKMFALFKKVGVKCVVLCSCWSFNQAKAISELGIPVVGMLRRIEDDEAILFSRSLYHLLVSNNPLELIFELARAHVKASSQDIPSLWYNGKRIA